jgi:hypothetical protein
MKRLLELTALVALLPLALVLTGVAVLLYFFAPHEIWLLLFAFVVWRAHWLRRDEPTRD